MGRFLPVRARAHVVAAVIAELAYPVRRRPLRRFQIRNTRKAGERAYSMTRVLCPSSKADQASCGCRLPRAVRRVRRSLGHRWMCPRKQRARRLRVEDMLM